eukprot:Gb_01448 [translate_table: standard]
MLRSCGLGRVCRIMQLLANSIQLMELIQHWDIDRQAFILPTFGVMRITRYDIYCIMGVSRTGDEVITELCSAEDACTYLGGADDASFIGSHGIRVDVLRQDRVPRVRRIIALIILFRISFSHNFSGLPFSWASVIRQCERGVRLDWATYISVGLHRQLDNIRQRGTGGLSYTSLVMSWLYEHFHIFRPRIGPPLPLGRDDPAMLRWQMLHEAPLDRSLIGGRGELTCPSYSLI